MEKPNIDYIKNLSGGDVAFEKKIIGILKAEFPEEKNTYLVCIQNKKYKDTAEIVHKLKHKISILGLERGYQTAALFEEELLEEKTVLKEDFEKILALMTNYIDHL